mmetsp:Transcript_17452/g.54518  ORF Transcript_17452/g.54518 Transcript_17452/m.54518 type:complete len:290 (-) Transcript_17452:122-991(-)
MVSPAGEDGREASRAAAFNDDLLVLEQAEDAEGDLLLLDDDDVVRVLLGDGEGVAADCRHGEAVGEGRGRRCRHGLARRQRGRERGARGGLDADDRRLGSERLDRERDAREQPGAAARDEDEVKVVQLVDELEAQRPRAGDDRLVVVAVHVRQPAELGRVLRERLRLADVRPVHYDVRLERPTLLALRQRRHRRHQHRHRDPQLLPVPRQRQRVVTRRRRHHACRLLLLAQTHQRVPRSALLERPREHRLLVLQVYLASANLRQPVRVCQVRPHHSAANARRGASNVFE